jgi:hypothetical protein
MAITLNTPRKYLSEVLSNFNDLHNVEYHFARVTVTSATAVNIDPIGQPVIWNGTSFVFFSDATDLAEATTAYEIDDGAIVPLDIASDLPDGSPIGVVVGSAMGVGINDHDVTVDSTGVELTVLYRGTSSCKTAHIDWEVLDADGDPSVTPADAAAQAAFIKQLEKQGVAEVNSAEVINPTYVGE